MRLASWRWGTAWRTILPTRLPYSMKLSLSNPAPRLCFLITRERRWHRAILPVPRRWRRGFIQKYPGDRQQLAQAHQLLGRTLLKLNRNQEARKELEAAVALDPTFPNGYDLAVACLDLGDEKCAVQLFSEMEKSFGDTPEIHMAFGRRHYADSDFQPRGAVYRIQAGH